jgi:hypothetical protein
MTGGATQTREKFICLLLVFLLQQVVLVTFNLLPDLQFANF